MTSKWLLCYKNLQAPPTTTIDVLLNASWELPGGQEGFWAVPGGEASVHTGSDWKRTWPPVGPAFMLHSPDILLDLKATSEPC